MADYQMARPFLLGVTDELTLEQADHLAHMIETFIYDNGELHSDPCPHLNRVLTHIESEIRERMENGECV